MKKQRYSFWRVFWVVLSVYVFFTVLGFIVLSVVPGAVTSATNKELNWSDIFTLQYCISQVASFIFSTFFYFFSLNAYYRLIAERKTFVGFLKASLVALVALAIYFAFTFTLLNKDKMIVGISSNHYNGKLPLGLIIFSCAFSAFFFIGISLLISYLTYLRDEKKQRKVLEEQKMQLEVEKSQANFNFLKAQINPHFLHNTLNFFYAKALPLSAELSEGILTLSDIMRYALSEGNARDGKAPLKDEIEHVRNVIKIQQLRFNNKLKVNFDVEGVINGATIIPFVLITLVENAFKHGDLKNPDNPIDIKLQVDNNKLYFSCRNKKKIGPKELSTGIGLDNIKKRLDLAYRNNYRFNVKDEVDFYTIELTILSL